LRIIVSGRHLDLTDALRDYAEEKVGAAALVLEDRITNVKVLLTGEASNQSHLAEVICTIPKRGTVVAHAKHENLYAAIDLVADKVARQLRRAKERGRSRRSPSRRA
jgi:putative sigma-54 modulation protein